MSDTSLWIFGYGSLVWRPGFAHVAACRASIDGWSRRFWQGSTDHRGVPGSPGRVVTLISNSDDPSTEADLNPNPPCWGTAYEVAAGDPEQVLARLDHRERGGYDRVVIEISIFDAGPVSCDEAEQSPRIVPGLVYIAGPENADYLGPAPIAAIAKQVACAAGPSGENSEYVFELASSLRAMGAVDSHVFAVEEQLAKLELGK